MKKAQIFFTFLNNTPSFLRRALSRTSGFFVRHLVTKHLQNTRNVRPGAAKSPLLQHSELTAKPRSYREITASRQEWGEAKN